MGRVRIGAMWHSPSTSARPLRSAPAVLALALSAMQQLQWSVAELSERASNVKCFIWCVTSATPKCITSAANSRSELVRLPPGLMSDTMI
eukprot:15358235-Ditylum_brightwellii.AAC.2